MTEPSTIQQTLAAEQAAINTMADTTESALAGASLRWKIASHKGEKGAVEELMKAESALREYRENKEPSPGAKGQAESTPGEWFKNETEAYNYLMSLGYEVSRGKFNTDKNNGLLMQDGKRISKFSVLQYGLRLKKDRQFIGGVNSADLQAQREEAETKSAIADSKIKQMKEEEMRRELDRKWLHRDTALENLAAIWAAVQQALDHALHVGAEAVTLACGGDPNRANEVEDVIQEMIFARAFNEVSAAGRIHVIFKNEEEQE